MKQSIFVLSLLVGTAACGERTEKLTQLPQTEASAAAAERPVDVQTLTVSRSQVDRAVLATGTTEPLRAADLGPQLTARINAVLVKEGDEVKAGAPLARLDVADAEIRLRQTEASAASSLAQYQLAASEYERMAPLAPQGTVTPQTVSRLAAQRDALKAASDAASIAAENARHTLGDAVVRAPFAGVISRVPVEVGEVATMVPTTTIARLVDLSSVDVRMRVHERDLARVQVGDPVNAVFPSTGEKLEGTIAFISPEIDPRTRTAEVVTRIPNGQRTLRAGMFAEIEVRSRDRHQGIVLPRSALGGAGDTQFVLLLKGGVLERRNVKALPVDAIQVEILEGLSGGEEVVSADVTRLSPGMKAQQGKGRGGEK
jgi:membrane fusion protein (multidrug efflux system)